MSRLIDADELKKCVLKWLPQDPCGREEKEFPFETDICVSMLMEIDEQPTITPESHWIPVKERLPKESGSYQITTTHGKVAIYVFGADSISSHEYWKRCVTAWIPLPEPYKEVTE